MPAHNDAEPRFYDRQFLPSTPGVPLQVATVDFMREQLGDPLMERRGRVFFHLVVVCTGGEALHEVDFTPVSLTPGQILHIRPGQVHRWIFERSYEATVILFDETTSRLTERGWPSGPRWLEPDEAEMSRTQLILNIVDLEMASGHSVQRRDRVLHAAVQMLIVSLGLDLGNQADSANLPPPYLELLDQLEEDPGWSRSVRERAQRLGYSERTVARACLAATGRTAKQVIDDRIVLEARRLLSQEGSTIGAVARALSFPEPSNFTKFFRRTTGETPHTWRTQDQA